ncbi:MAG: S8 family serine peptidase [Actinoplanes sp.]
MRRRRLPALLLAIVTITAGAGITGAPAAQALPAEVLAGKPATRTATHAITLITGDRVTVHGDGTTTVQPGAGRKDIKFVSYRAAKSNFVIPSDALSLLRAGKLDRRLFDVTALAGFGYTDDKTKDLPLLVGYPKAANRQAKAAATVPGARVERDLPAVGALAVRADRAGRVQLWRSLTGGTAAARSLQPGIEHVWLDGKRKINLDVSVPQIGAPAAWAAGFDGTGVTVAILDTGIDATHPDLAGKITEAVNFTSAPDADDTVGHGTHVASTIAGSGAASGGRYKGVAPGAKLLIGKVCEDSGCEESDILAGMAWAAERAPVINMSLGGDSEDIDPLEEAVNGLTAQFGTLFVIAAGNSGGDETVGSPASADAALAVGAVDRDNQLADFSSRGPRVGDHAVKPEITAPGVDIVAARAAHDVIGGPAPVEGYSTLSGTSMATPHVAGAAAILVQQHPGWTAQQRKTILMGSAKPTPGLDVFGQGAGRVDVAREITQTVAVNEGSLSFAGQPWPHADDTPVTKTVTYRNDGTAAVTLTLAITSTAPAGAFTTADSTLTVPAGGTATTTVTADTSVDGPDGVYSGYLTATAAGGVQVQTPIAVDREVESYDVTFSTLGRDGKPAENAFVTLFDPEAGKFYDVNGGATKRLPKGEYGLYSIIFEGETDATMLVQPSFTVTGDATVVLDARVAKPIKITVPDPAAKGTLATVNADWSNDDYGFGATLIAFETEGLYSGQVGSKEKVDDFVGSIGASYAEPGADESFRNSPYTYDLAYYFPGKMPVGLNKAPKRSDLATIKATYATGATGAYGLKSNASRYTLLGGGWSVQIPFDLPFQRTEYVNTDGKAKWTSDFYQELPAVGDEWPVTLSVAWDGLSTYRGGTTHRQEWNKAVFAPSVSHAQYDWDYLVRTGDTIVAGIPTFGEGPGHPGYSTVDSAKLSLYRGNTLVASSDEDYAEFAVPAEAANYRLELTADRGTPHVFSTQVLGTWTFRSGHVAGEEPKRLAASTVRFDPKLDLTNKAQAGKLLAVPVHVDHQLGTTTTKLTVEASFDDGQTWKSVRVVGSGDHRTALVRHPSGAGFVSLRGHATDRAGNKVDQTVIRAYAIG